MKFETLETSDIKNKYFYRTEKWDWLNHEMIHVFDSKSPRVITMDPWPQKIFLEALGQLTVHEYVYKVANEYPNGHVPKELDIVILEMLNNLINNEKIVALSDTPMDLEISISNPMTEEGEINLEGTWKGTYQYNIHEELIDEQLKEVEFTIVIDKLKGISFSGTVEDNLETGGTPGKGIIKGKINNDQIQFNKEMPVHASINEKGERIINQNKKHHTIIYKGEFSRSKKSIHGYWEFKKRVWLWKGIIPYRVSLGNGTFTMHKNE